MQTAQQDMEAPESTLVLIYKTPDTVDNNRKNGPIVKWLEKKDWLDIWFFHPNVLSLDRGLLALWPIFSYLAYGSIWNIGTIIAIVLAIFTDYFDGLVAIARDKITRAGAFLDPLADKVFIWPFFFFLLYDSFFYVMAFAFALDIISQSIKLTKWFFGVKSLPANGWGKAKFSLQCTSLGFLGLPVPYFDIVGIILFCFATAAALVSIVLQIKPEWSPKLNLKK